jgi:hypothetical protein
MTVEHSVPLSIVVVPNDTISTPKHEARGAPE